MAVLIYFIHHIAMSIQLPQVIASIADDLSRAIDAESRDDGVSLGGGTVGAGAPEANDRLGRDRSPAPPAATCSSSSTRR